jgi:L-fucose isomerase-like protein
MITVQAGFVGFACSSYPREIISPLVEKAKAAVQAEGIPFVAAGLCSTFAEADETIAKLRGQEIDYIIACIPSWIETPVVLRVLMEFRHLPVLVWGLGGYTKDGSLVSPAAPAGTSALCDVMDRFGFRFKHIYEWPDSPLRPQRVRDFALAVQTVKKLFHSRIGMMGYADMGLYTTMFDGVSLRAKIGPEVEVFDMLELIQKQDEVSQEELEKFIATVRQEWQFEQPVADVTLERLGKITLAADRLIDERNYSAISFKCVEGMKKYMQFPPCLVQSILGDKVPAICEDDALGLVTQLILNSLTGQATTFVETYEFFQDRILVGVCGFVPGSYVCGPKCASVYGGWGGLNAGVMSTSAMKTGPVTVARVGNRGEDYFIHVIKADGVKPRRWEELGWNAPAPQFPGLELQLAIPVEQFVDKIISQHYLIAYGDHVDAVQQVANLLGIRIIQ